MARQTVSNPCQLLLVQRLGNLDNLLRIAQLDNLVELADGVAMNHCGPFLCLLIGGVKLRLVLERRQHCPASGIGVVDNHAVGIGQQLKVWHIACVRTHGAKKIAVPAVQRVHRQHRILRHLLEQRQAVLAADCAGHLHRLCLRQTRQLHRLTAFNHAVHIGFNRLDILSGQLLLAVVDAVERTAQRIAHLQMHIRAQLLRCRQQHEEQSAHIYAHALRRVDLDKADSAVSLQRTL